MSTVMSIVTDPYYGYLQHWRGQITNKPLIAAYCWYVFMTRYFSAYNIS